MAKWTIVYGLVLVALGGFGYSQAEVGEDGAKSVTAMIPAFIGLPVILCGLLCLTKKHILVMIFMHLAVLLALFGTSSIVMFFIGVVKKGKDPMALGPQMQMLTAIASAIYLVFAIRSFVLARKSK